MKKIQLPAIGGIRKVIEIPDAGTTIAEIGSGTITLPQLAKLITVAQQNQTAPTSNLVGTGNEASLRLGAGLSGGGVLLGTVFVRLDTSALPGANAFALMDDAAGGGPDYPHVVPGPQGARGAAGLPIPMYPDDPDDPQVIPGAAGATGATGAAGLPIPMYPDDPDDPQVIPGTAGAAGAAGATGATGAAGLPIPMYPDDPDDPQVIPGTAGAAGAAGATGATGAAGLPIPMYPDDPDDPQVIPGTAGAAGAAGATGATGAAGLPIPMYPDDPDDPQVIPGTAGAAGAAGATGATGAAGLPIPMYPDDPDDPQVIPGTAGAAGAAGATGATGAAGLPIPMYPDDPDDPQVIPGTAGAAGAAGATGATGAAGLPIPMYPDDPDDPQVIPGQTGATGATGPAGASSSSGGIPVLLHDFNEWDEFASQLRPPDLVLPILTVYKSVTIAPTLPSGVFLTVGAVNSSASNIGATAAIYGVNGNFTLNVIGSVGSASRGLYIQAGNNNSADSPLVIAGWNGTTFLTMNGYGQTVLAQNSSGAGATLTVNGVNSAYALTVAGGSGTGTSYGLSVKAGTNASDYALVIQNAAGTGLVTVNGYGNVTISAQNSTYAALQVNGVASNYALNVQGAGGQYAAAIVGNGSTGTSNGLVVYAGTNGSDYALVVSNKAGSSLFIVNGSGLTLNYANSIGTSFQAATAWMLDFTGGANYSNETTILNNGIYTLPTGSGLVAMYPTSTTALGTCLAWLAYGGISFIVSGSGFSGAASTSGKVNIYYNGSNYVIQNLTGSTVTIAISTIRLRSTN